MGMQAFAAILVVLTSACAPASTVAPAPDAAIVTSNIIATGARVRVKSRSGTFKPIDTGHATEVNVTAGKTGAVMQVLGESVRVRFDAQVWDEFPPTGATVQLQEFEATLHISYLQTVR